MESSSQLSPGGPVPRPRRRSPRLRWLENLRDRLPQRSSLPQLMFAPFATQLLLAMALVLGLSYQMAGRIINQLTSELGGQIGERVLQELNAQLSAPRQVNAINAKQLLKGGTKFFTHYEADGEGAGAFGELHDSPVVPKIAAAWPFPIEIASSISRHVA